MDAINYVKQGNVKLSNGDYQGAIADYNAALKHNASLEDAYFGLGFAYFQLGNDAASNKALSVSIQMQPNGPRAAVVYTIRCMARSNLGDRKGALQDYQVAIAFNPQVKDFIQSQSCVGTAQVFVLAMVYPAAFAAIVEQLTRA